MYNKTKYFLAVILAFNLLFTGCASRDSGLYRIEHMDEIPDEESPEDTGGEPADAGEAVEILQPSHLFVHVCGAVKDPGVYEMETGDRVFNAVEAAGGFREDAHRDYINLAQALADGMKITVPTVEEVGENSTDLHNSISMESDAGLSQPAGYADSADSGSAGSTPGVVNINTASESELMSIPGIGQTRAAAIIAYRNQQGAFRNTDDIKNVSGIGDATYERIKDSITVGR